MTDEYNYTKTYKGLDCPTTKEGKKGEKATRLLWKVVVIVIVIL
jgi:hypothetical protein